MQFGAHQYESRRVSKTKIAGTDHGKKSPAVAIVELNVVNHDQVEPGDAVAVNGLRYAAEGFDECAIELRLKRSVECRAYGKVLREQQNIEVSCGVHSRIRSKVQDARAFSN